MLNMIGPIIPAVQASEMVDYKHPYLLTICLSSNTVEAFQCTRMLDGRPVVAISYESEGFCAPVEGVLTNEAHQCISGYDEVRIVNAAREYRIAKLSLVGVELYGEGTNLEPLKDFFAKKCRDIHFMLADEYNILVDSLFFNRGGFTGFENEQQFLNQGNTV